MTPISQMADADLRLAIAEELGKEYCVCDKPTVASRLGGPDFGECTNCGKNLPNWPCDVAAALGLLDEISGYTRRTALERWEKEPWDVKIIPNMNGLVYGNDGKGMKAMSQSMNESLARAICEAWLTAKRPEIALGPAGDSPPSTTDPLKENDG